MVSATMSRHSGATPQMGIDRTRLRRALARRGRGFECGGLAQRLASARICSLTPTIISKSQVSPTRPSLMQKLVTIYLDNTAYGKGKMIVGSFADKHGLIEEHLQSELAAGWKIASITGLGGSADALAVRGWLAVVLEK